MQRPPATFDRRVEPLADSSKSPVGYHPPECGYLAENRNGHFVTNTGCRACDEKGHCGTGKVTKWGKMRRDESGHRKDRRGRKAGISESGCPVNLEYSTLRPPRSQLVGAQRAAPEGRHRRPIVARRLQPRDGQANHPTKKAGLYDRRSSPACRSNSLLRLRTVRRTRRLPGDHPALPGLRLSRPDPARRRTGSRPARRSISRAAAATSAPAGYR